MIQKFPKVSLFGQKNTYLSRHINVCRGTIMIYLASRNVLAHWKETSIFWFRFKPSTSRLFCPSRWYIYIYFHALVLQALMGRLLWWWNDILQYPDSFERVLRMFRSFQAGSICQCCLQKFCSGKKLFFQSGSQPSIANKLGFPIHYVYKKISLFRDELRPHSPPLISVRHLWNRIVTGFM